MAWVLLSPAVFAQDEDAAPAAAEASPPEGYLELEVEAKLGRDLRLRVVAMRADGFKPGDQAVFDKYYKKYVFPGWTDPDNWTKRKNPREGILDDLRRAQPGAVYDRLNRLVLEQMVEMVGKNYHPVTRFNAMLMIGQLNVEEPGFNKPPKPLPKAFSILLSSAEDKNLPDAVRYGALLGILRHCEYGAADEESRQKISNLMFSLATMRDPPPGCSKEGHGWFRRLAIDTLGRLRSPGPQGAVAKAMVRIVSESDASLPVRCEAARALGRLRLTPQTGLDLGAVGKALEELLIDIAKEEIRLRNIAEKKIRLTKENDDYKIDPSKLKARLIPIRAALTGYENEEARVRAEEPIKGILGLAAGSEQEKPLLSLRQKVEYLLNKEHLDHKDLVPKVEKAKQKKPERDALLGMGHEGLGHEGPGAMGTGPIGGGDLLQPPDPAKVVSDRIMAELIKLVEESEKREATR